MRILVTGATGFLGSHLCRRLVIEGHGVRAFCRPAADRTVLQDQPAEVAVGDVTDASAVGQAVAGCDAVLHAAAVSGRGAQDAASQWRVNVEGTRNVVRACGRAGVRRLVFVSSIAAIGIPEDRRPADESFVFNLDNTPLTYQLSKRRAEECVLLDAASGLDPVIVNPATILGPHGRQYRGAELIDNVRLRTIVPYFTGGFCVVHVDDVVQGILLALERGASGQRYILGGENVTHREVVARAAAALGVRRRFVPIGPLLTGPAAVVLEAYGRIRGRRPPITFDTFRYFAHRYHFYDWSRARRELGYRPRTFDQILPEMLAARPR